MKINIFKSLSDNISKLFSKKIEISPEQQFFDKKFAQFLQVEDCIFCYKMMEEGYEPSDSLKQQLEKVMLEKIEKKVYSETKVEEIKNLTPIVRMQNLFKYLDISTENYNFFQPYGYNNNSHSEQYIANMFKDEQMQTSLYQYFISRMNYAQIGANESTMKHNNNVMYVGGILIRHGMFNEEQTQVIRDKVKELYDIISETRIDYSYINSYLEKITQYQAQQLSSNNNKEDVIRQLKSFKARSKSLSEQMNHLVINEEYSIENLPLEAKQKVHTITEAVNKMNNEEINNFVEERLPVILKKYFSIDKEYRTELKNVEGFNAEELMNQSLDNIERIVKAKQQDNNYNLLSELSIEKRKLKVKA